MEAKYVAAYLRSKVSRLSQKHVQVINTFYPDIESALDDSFAEIHQSGERFFKLPKLQRWRENCEKYVASLIENQIGAVEMDWNLFCPHLNTGSLPYLMFFQGSIDTLTSNIPFLSIVGSRKLTQYTKFCLQKIVKPVTSSIVTVSGFAAGTDIEAHKLSFENHQPTIAVLGSGLNHNVLYPKDHLRFVDNIIQSGGLLLSEYTPNFQPTHYSFAQRNELIAVLSDRILIAQAAKGSGSLITSRYAQKWGIPIATIPADLTSSVYEGNFELIKRGVKVIIDSDDLAEWLNVKNSAVIQSFELSKCNENQKLIMQTLQTEKLDIDNLNQKTGLSVSELVSELSLLELEGVVCQIDNSQWLCQVRIDA